MGLRMCALFQHFFVKTSIFLLSILSYNIGAHAQGNLLIFPKRIVFDNTNIRNIQHLNLTNTSEDTAVYNVSFIQYRMGENGEFQSITEPDSGQFFASPFLRVFPRRVVLAPGESQSVRVQLTRQNELKEGEYRSHLFFRAVDMPTPLGESVAEQIDSNSIAVKLKAVFGISIACIIKHGAPDVSVSIEDIEFESQNDSLFYLSFTIYRSGNMSAYGDIQISYTDKSNKTHIVARLNGLAVYTPGNLRKCRIKIQNMTYAGGHFEVIYLDSQSGKKNIIAKAQKKL